VHQLALISTNQKDSHGRAMKILGRDSFGTKDMGIIMKPEQPVPLICYADADYFGTWEKRIASNDPDTARCRSSLHSLQKTSCSDNLSYNQQSCYQQLKVN
jgi:hypothetical protein